MSASAMRVPCSATSSAARAASSDHGSAGIAHLGDPSLLGKLASARGQLLGAQPSDAPVTLALVLSTQLSGLLACAVAGWFR